MYLSPAKKSLEEEKSKQHSEKDRVHCLWDSITMTMRQITPSRKMDKIEGWEPPQLKEEALEEEKSETEGKKSDSSPLSSPLSLSLPGPLTLPSWTGLGGSEEDSSRYSSLTEPSVGRPVQWAARARDKLAAVRRRSPGTLSESSWEGLKWEICDPTLKEKDQVNGASTLIHSQLCSNWKALRKVHASVVNK